MGNSVEQRHKDFKDGFIFVQTDKSIHKLGQEITGRVYLRLFTQI